VTDGGVEDFFRMSKALKGAGRTELRRELHKGLKDGVKPLVKQANRVLAEGLPAPLAARGNRTKQVVLVQTGKTPAITIGMRFGGRGTGLGVSNARLANRLGVIRHPVWGNRQVWANTPVPGALGWFDDTYAAGAPTIRPELDAAVRRVVEQIIREAR
jgi:hypothetical protein